MTDEHVDFDKTLTKLLSLLHKKDWASPLKGLEQKFRLAPDCDFAVELINMLHQLNDAMVIDSDTPISQLAAIRLSAFDCWTYRFYRDDAGGRHYLDPLTTPVSAFFSSVSVAQSNSPFPAADIIKRWAREQLR